ncbi:SLA class II histocompatibility antigen, DQ haplotype D beta chain-like isoform X3 [Carcharodon carcharias]|uniref:SLA class II histocompatibility antigen, DQ haplotype D beta chain-like isoform X3 n=1 Tax=Carcharodon carcharias TaxID=13397 RepID=UPI001B7F32C6|nr:SLA class II histocompatibility antigen, DQ haplotype D beta chain-like isoform X3 [Carcharodon carcharias]XP_041035561.1 SLA class II histocompatibility antigen, DQ haplotype D beta chain-like isoform X3 [Carcharodon carcharias]
MPPLRNVIPHMAISAAALYFWCCVSLISALGVVQEVLDCDRAAVSQKDVTGCFCIVAYNKNILTRFDTKAGRLTVESLTVKNEVDSLNKDPRALKIIQDGIQDSVNFLSLLLEAGADTLDREVSPSVTISFHDLEDFDHSSQLQCTVAGFYPSALNVTWLKNDGNIDEQVVQTQILPNSEKAFQTAAFTNIDPKTEDTYTCFVEHVTFPDGLRTNWVPQPKSSLSAAAIVGILFGIGGILTAITGAVFRMKRQGYQPRIPGLKVLFWKNQQQQKSNRSQASMHSNTSASSATSGDGLTKDTV